ncbi:disintegrin and metalloproteinase domain-containing protein 10-like isoform X2 [Rhipicephalus microplus]|uniref:disintegrin and metalloproteinase domain-containing protein 10-like isoform X2 n=1 Tax=Rhipicephalus microplus TaxID=6941 RepID=UPI003F6B8399
MDPSLFLLTAAKSANYDEYCLAYTWTYRDFDSGVLGLAYVGNSTKESGPVCGNGIVEGVEECDCGYSEAECHDPCCYARRNSVNAKGCTLRPGKQCSPTTGPCCDKDCKLVPTTTMCAPETECREKAMCTYPLRGLAPLKFTHVMLLFSSPNVA